MARFNGASYRTSRSNGQLLSYKVRPALVQYLTQSTAPTTAGIGSVAPSGNVPMDYAVKYCACHGKPLGNATIAGVWVPWLQKQVPVSLQLGTTHRWCLQCSQWVFIGKHQRYIPQENSLPPGKQPYNGSFTSGTATVGATHCANPSNGKV